jgi:penicillin-binding protein 1A
MKLRKRLSITFLWLALAGSSAVLMGLTGMHLYLGPTLPSVDSLRDVRLQTPLRIYSSDGKLIGEFGEKRRTPVAFHEIPQPYIDALLAAEDAEFYSHHGVSITGLMRAASQLLMSGDIQGGGSTITMQVARNYFLTFRQEFRRKFREILLAMRIERELTKEQILELYVNVIFLGNRSYGIQAAAQTYYGKPLSDLSVAQMAMIAGLPKAPSTMNPLVNPERALIRRNWILGRMRELGWLDEMHYQQAINEPLTAKHHGSNVAQGVDASYVAEMARQKAISLFGPAAYTDGYRIYTTIDSELQASAERAVVKGLQAYDRRHGYRGPEQRFTVTDALLLPQPTADDNTEEDGTQTHAVALDLDKIGAEWREALRGIPAFAGLRPAAVVSVENKSFKALLATGDVVEVSWDQGLKDAKPYISENTVGPAPESASEVVNLGDVVRLNERLPGSWHLDQIPAVQSALVSLDPDNGAILSLVGGFDFHHNNFNRATQAYRQPGSIFKPFIYTAALENGFTAATIVNDAPIVFSDSLLETSWRPENSSGKFYGPTRLRKALYLSRNLVSIRVLRSIGINSAIAGMARFGFDEGTLPRNLSLALGSANITPLELATAYAVFANGGYKVEPYFIQRILDFDGHTVHEALPPTVCKTCEDEDAPLPGNIETAGDSGGQGRGRNGAYGFEGDPFEISFAIKSLLNILEPQDYPQAPRVLEPEVAYIIDSMLQDVVQRGTARRAKTLARSDLAGKTGTTNGPTDAWFSGYNGDVVTTTWVGFDQMSNLGNNEYGGSAALPIWIDFMRTALRGRPETPRIQPEGIVTVRIDPETGKRAPVGDPNAIFEIFRSDNVPSMPQNNGLDSPYDEDALTEGLF